MKSWIEQDRDRQGKKDGGRKGGQQLDKIKEQEKEERSRSGSK